MQKGGITIFHCFYPTVPKKFVGELFGVSEYPPPPTSANFQLKKKFQGFKTYFMRYRDSPSNRKLLLGESIVGAISATDFDAIVVNGKFSKYSNWKMTKKM